MSFSDPRTSIGEAASASGEATARDPDAFKLVPEDRRRLGLDLTRQRLVRLDFATAARLFR